MKKLLFLIAGLLLSATVSAAAVTAEDVGKNLKPGRGHHSANWGKEIVDPAWGYTIKAQAFSCPLAAGENCRVIYTFFLGGGDDVAHCYLVRADEVTQYPNQASATRSVNFCSRLPQFARYQKFVDPDGDAILTPSVFVEWRFTIVKTQL
jgi:hypothetical protein